MKYTRKDYLNKTCTHREYYGQLVDQNIRDIVADRIGKKRIQKSQNEHLNDIPLHEWDSLRFSIQHYVGTKIREANPTGVVSLFDCVYVAKEAAKQIKEAKEAIQPSIIAIGYSVDTEIGISATVYQESSQFSVIVIDTDAEEIIGTKRWPSTHDNKEKAIQYAMKCTGKPITVDYVDIDKLR